MELTGTPHSLLLTHWILMLLLISVGVTDLKYNCIYNWQTYPAILCGLVLGAWGGGWQGLWFSFSGLVVGFALLFAFYLLGGFGAGDVKLLAAIGALKGVNFIVWTMAYSALVGGIMAFAVMIWRGVFWRTLRNSFYMVCHPIRAHKTFSDSPQVYLPYGLAISIGCCWALLTG